MTPTAPTTRIAVPAEGYGLIYAIRTARAWWYSAWLRSLARFRRTYLGSFWLGLSNLLTVSLLALVYGTVFSVQDPIHYAMYLGFGITIWGYISQSLMAGCGLFTGRREQLVNNSQPAVFYGLEEWSFQLQTFIQSFLVILVVAACLRPVVLVHALTVAWLPFLNVILFGLWGILLMAVLGSRFKDFGQLMPIVLQLLFLVSPILYERKNLGSMKHLMLFNPLYRVLASLRDGLISGHASTGFELGLLLLQLLLIALTFSLLKALRYRIPFWV